MAKTYKKYLLCVSMLCFFHACTSNAPKKAVDVHGYYKVGNPYEIKGKWYEPKKDPTYQEEGVASWYGPSFHGNRTANGAKFNTNTMTAAHRTLPLPSMVRVTNLSNNKSVEVMVNDRGPFAKDRIIDVSKQAAGQLDFIRQGTAHVRVEFLTEKTKTLLLSMGLPSDQVEKDTSPVLFSKYETPTLKSASSSVIADNLTPLKNETASTTFEPAAFDTPSSTIAATTGIPKQYIQVGTFSVKENAEKIQANLKNIGDVALNQVKVGDKSLYRVQIGPLTDQAAAKAALQKAVSQGHANALLVMN